MLLSFFVVSPAAAGTMLPPVQAGSLLRMTNGNVRLDYDLQTGRANFYWQNTLKISGSNDDYSVGAQKASIVCGNVPTANATVYIVDSVLMPKM